MIFFPPRTPAQTIPALRACGCRRERATGERRAGERRRPDALSLLHSCALGAPYSISPRSVASHRCKLNQVLRFAWKMTRKNNRRPRTARSANSNAFAPRHTRTPPPPGLPTTRTCTSRQSNRGSMAEALCRRVTANRGDSCPAKKRCDGAARSKNKKTTGRMPFFQAALPNHPPTAHRTAAQATRLRGVLTKAWFRARY